MGDCPGVGGLAGWPPGGPLGVVLPSAPGVPGVDGLEDALAFSCLALWSFTSMACCLESLRNFSRLFCISEVAAETLSSSDWSMAVSSPPFFFIVRCLELRDWKRKVKLQRRRQKRSTNTQQPHGKNHGM